MEINEKTKINLGFLSVIIGGLISFAVLFASDLASKEYVKDKVLTLETRLDRLINWMEKIDSRLYEIQKELNTHKQ